MRAMSRRIGLVFSMTACLMALAQAAAGQPAPTDHQNAIGSVQGGITGSFQGDPAQANVGRPTVPVKPPGKPPGQRPPVIIVNPNGYQTRPLRSLTGDDYRNAVERALGAPVGQMISWINATGAGQLTPLGDRFVDGMNCRDLKQSVTTVGSSAETTTTYCLSPGGEWLLLMGPS